MKIPGTPIRHAGGNYLLVEGGYSHDTRSITLLAEPENSDFSHPERAQRIVWIDQGEWYPIAQWSVGMVALQENDYSGQRPLIDEIFERFRLEQQDLPTIAWAIQGEGGFAGTLEPILPMGLAVKVFEDEAGAAEVSGAEQLVPITNLPNFLTHLAREGYAGVMMDGQQPLFFCIDSMSELQFLRVRRSDGGSMQLDILDEQGGWLQYEGSEEIEMLENRDACDNRLVETIGRRPVMSWPNDGEFWSVGPKGGSPGLITNEEDELSYGLLFVDEDEARDWREDTESPWVSFPVEDLNHFLSRKELEDCGALLNPGSHRVHSGILWLDGERIVLDSYSGYWALDGDEFEQVG
ncbi:MAG: hypothetical protein P8N09_08775 [Planctomycetota bacterium]|jgi:hypothetical protein|nr:hypothetical protein [Planctomycetota bacterium]